MTTDIEFYEFLEKNEEKTKILLEDFKNTLIRNIFSSSKEISSRKMSAEEMIKAIEEEEDICKKIEHLCDIKSPFIGLYFKVDIQFNLKCMKKNNGNT